MATVYNPQIVTNGLVLCLDAANPKSYPGSGITWGDVSGQNHTGTLTFGPSYSVSNGGTISFDGSNDYVSTTFNTALADFTICCWFRKTGGILQYERVVDKSYVNGFWIGRDNNNANRWGGGVRESSNPYGRYVTLTDGQWHFIVSRRQGTTHTIFGDGVSNSTSGTVSSTALDTTNLRLGIAIEGSNPILGNIAVLNVYNRALSNDEISQNFNALRGRFGV